MLLDPRILRDYLRIAALLDERVVEFRFWADWRRTDTLDLIHPSVSRDSSDGC